ncbi:MAG: hypothetical protein Q8R33_15485 [Burkholderiales bacterium]|nr:hypothetical protein [Burkholderiales bacterium]
MRTQAALVFAAILLAGCAAPIPPMDREQYLAATSRTYAGATKDQVIAAAEQVLKLAEFWEMQIAHTDEGFNAFRQFDAWEIKVRDTPQGARGFLQVRSATNSTFLAPTTSIGTYSVASSTSPTTVVQGDALYSLFWSRVDYMLFKKDTWTSCAEANQSVGEGKISGPLDALCAYALHDDVPGQPRKPRYPNAAAQAANPGPVVLAPDRKR